VSAFPISIEVTIGVAEYAGATPTPPDTRTEPTATSASLPIAVVLVAVIMSPIACEASVMLEPSFAAMVFDVAGNVIVVASVPASVIVFEALRTLPDVILIPE
jgi:hypothetical protein